MTFHSETLKGSCSIEAEVINAWFDKDGYKGVSTKIEGDIQSVY